MQNSIVWVRGWQIGQRAGIIHEEVKNRLNLRNACCCYVQTLLSAILYNTRNIRMHQIVIIRIILWGCETWKHRDKHKLKVTDNRGPKSIILALNYRRLIERLSSLYCLSNIVTAIRSKRMIWAGHTERMEELGYVARKTWREGLCGRLSIRGRISVKIDLKTLCVFWIKLAQYRVRCCHLWIWQSRTLVRELVNPIECNFTRWFSLFCTWWHINTVLIVSWRIMNIVNCMRVCVCVCAHIYLSAKRNHHTSSCFRFLYN